MVAHSLKGLFLLFLTVLSGCSSFTRFMIVNRTNASLMVSYGPPVGFFDLNGEKFENCFEDDIGSAYFPEVIESSRIEAHYSEWRKLTSDEYSCDFESRTISFELRSGQAVQIATVFDHLEFREFDSEEFGIRTLELEGIKGNVAFEAEQIPEAFDKKNIFGTISYLEYD